MAIDGMDDNSMYNITYYYEEQNDYEKCEEIQSNGIGREKVEVARDLAVYYGI